MFLPTTKEEMKKLGWDRPDVILVTGDAYIDSPHVGAAVIGQVLLAAGFRVGIIAQPETETDADITRLGLPKLFWGVTAGCVDSMVANFTALKKPIKNDDFTPGGQNTRRPNRAVIAYSNLIRRFCKNSAPIVLGGLEASLRRVSHYDFWSNSVRRSILFDAKADVLVYGMGEQAVVELARAFQGGGDFLDIPGICYASREMPPGFVELPAHEEVKKDKARFAGMFGIFHKNLDPGRARGLCQKQDSRYIVCNPPQPAPETRELDSWYELEYQRDVHPHYKKMGPVKALDTIRFSIATHRGCFGQCNFCAITAHQGREVLSRSEDSILREARRMVNLPGFKGNILDLGGPTANMYGMDCRKKPGKACPQERCLGPAPCKLRKVSHKPHLDLLEKVAALDGVKTVFVTSGVRHDLVLADAEWGQKYLRRLVRHHVSGQMKIAPEHSVPEVLDLMGKPGRKGTVQFKRTFDQLNAKLGKKQFLTYYFMAAHPGCTQAHMDELARFTLNTLKLRPRQVQIFTPTPSTWSTLMYYTEKDPATGEKIFVEKDPRNKQAQKAAVTPREDRFRRSRRKK